MSCSYRNASRLAGILVFIASAQFILAMIISEALYPNYSVSSNYISDLGEISKAGSVAYIFNSSIILLGLLAIVATYLIRHIFDDKPFLACLFLTGIGAMGVGLFPESFKVLHPVFSFIAFFFGALSAISSFRVLKSPFSYLSVFLGLLSLLALALFGMGLHLGLGIGGMERMIAYPILLWALGFGGHLIGKS
ncbi:hypothetical protein DRO54_02295 [Candidatus Bathyarchaeota archaeon]|nr:MAG: hypothetical protein DRO54_02295 [Candidatus Bathyarchaeota archaeon]